jgi:hypothetical protein
MGISLSQPRILVCEGSSDVSFFRHLIKSRGLPEFDIFQPNAAEGVPSGKGGYKAFLEGLSTVLPSSRITGVLVVGDNDLNPAVSFQDIRNQISGAGGYGVPEEPLQVARSERLPPVVVMMLPWAGMQGALESLCLDAVLGYRPHLRECVDHFSECTKTTEWEPTARTKMQLHALVAALCKSEPATALTHVWSKKETIVPLDQPAFDRVADFLRHFDQVVIQTT